MFRCFAQILLGVVFVFVVIILGIFAALKGSPTLKVRTGVQDGPWILGKSH